jgi:lipoprotein-releasing system ATP-binding protein
MSKPIREIMRLEGIRKSYNVGQPNEVEVLHGIDLKLVDDDFVALVGPSGSGKSTLLNVMGLLDTPTAGELSVLGQTTSQMNDQERTEIRSSALGFVFQFHHLIQAFSALDNVLIPIMLRSGKPNQLAISHARELLVAVGLEKHLHKRPNELSGGQQQRVAIARALASDPALILADEPTGNLDSQSAEEVFALFRKIQVERHCAVLLVTHDNDLSAQCDRTINLVDGRII